MHSDCIPVGNRDSSHLSSFYTVDAADRLTEDDSCYYGYDNAGRMIYRKNKSTSDSTAFEYTVDGQLVKASNDDIELQFAYDGIGNRIRKLIIENSDTTVIKYTYDGVDLLFEKDAGDTLRIRYLYGPGIDHILESVDSVGTKQHHGDGIGTITRVTDSTGTILKKITYDSFGNIVADSGSVIADDVTYTGREYESELGVYFFRNRYYDPLIGRFITRDPLGIVGRDFNLYRYVGNNPINFIDPFGWWRWPVNGPVTINSGYSSSRLHPVEGVYKPHLGIDIALELGQPALAAHAGRVVEVVFGNQKTSGYVKIKHEDGSHTIYVHVRPCAKVDDIVNEGQIIAVSDRSGPVTGPHLHFGYQPPNTPTGTRSNPMEILPPLNPRLNVNQPQVTIIAGQGFE